jgi:succinyl-CoA synthetase beta subunit
MARLHEYQGKELLKRFEIAVPKGGVATTPDEARALAAELGVPVMVKAQGWVTGRATMGGIKKAATPEEAAAAAAQMLGMKVKGFTVEQVLVEEQLDIVREFYAGLIIDDRAQAPLMLFSSIGGTGIEEIAATHPDKVARLHVDVAFGLQEYQARNLVRKTGVGGKLQGELAARWVQLYKVASTYEARAAEINPLVQTRDGKLYAADCRVTVDDYAVFRPRIWGLRLPVSTTALPRSWKRLPMRSRPMIIGAPSTSSRWPRSFAKGEGYIGFHGAGGGGSMMSMDAILRAGLQSRHLCRYERQSSASKVYRAAKIVLSVGPIDGYFDSGSGVVARSSSIRHGDW